MKYRIFTQLIISLILSFTAFQASACYFFYECIPTPDFFCIREPKKLSQFEREENLKLWQSLTSTRIPLQDIEQVVYKDSRDKFDGLIGWEKNQTSNQMYAYINNSWDSEVMDFLLRAKSIEEKWAKKKSPWYFPSRRDYRDEFDDFKYDIERCKDYKGSRLKDRYALQVVRALFASRQYENCIEYFDSVFPQFPDDNLMKRMAQRYVAGCWSRLGDDSERVDSIFAMAGDVWSLKNPRPVEFMLRHNPNAPQIMEYIRSTYNTPGYLGDVVPVAKAVLNDKRVVNKGDWAYLLAYYYNEFFNDAATARKYMNKALQEKFSTPELHDLARAYGIKIKANAGDVSNLLSDLKWLKTKCDVINPDGLEWVRRTDNIIYENCIPPLWRKKDYATAILLASYANLGTGVTMQPVDDKQWYSRRVQSIAEQRASEKDFNRYDYGSLSFQLMETLTSSQLAVVYSQMIQDTPLYNFLRKDIRNDRDYYYELIGTLALREENYERALNYLSKVSNKYLRTTNIYKEGYLNRDPFKGFPAEWKDFAGESFKRESAAGTIDDCAAPKEAAKLRFARRMLKYKNLMHRGKTADERAWARMMYAIGRENATDRCWALNYYSRGEFCTNLFYPSLMDWEDDFSKDKYGFLVNNWNTKNGPKNMKKEITAAVSLMEDPEIKARAEYLLGNVVTVVKKYPETSVADFVKTSCDRWKQWL
ncbi:MAG: hypothetical protein K2G40_05070 [Muribaculaceae bacterium]|nr:hypothetical protein [Muribaculaceae bacterium]